MSDEKLPSHKMIKEGKTKHRFSAKGWSAIQEFNRKAADPNYPEVQFTFAKRPDLAAAAGRKPRSALSKKNISLSHRISHAKKAIVAGKVPTDSQLSALMESLNSYDAVSAGYFMIVEDLLKRVEQLPTERDQFTALTQVAKLHEPILKVLADRQQSVFKKIPVDSLNEMIQKAKADRVKYTMEKYGVTPVEDVSPPDSE
jgi:hypothetical protein